MADQKYDPIHPGEILSEEFLVPLELSARKLAATIHVPTNRVTRLIRGQTRVTADTAIRLSQAFNTTPEFWMNLQSRYDLQTAEDSQFVQEINSVI